MKKTSFTLILLLFGISLYSAELTDRNERNTKSHPSMLTTTGETGQNSLIGQSGDGDIIPRRYRGYSFYSMYHNAKDAFSPGGVFAGIHSGQFLNSSYGMLTGNGRMKSKIGYSMGVYISAMYPVFLDIEYSQYRDAFDENYSNTNKSFSGFVSLAVFPWTFKGGDVIVPIAGIGIQKGTFGPNWKFSSDEAPEPADVVIQPLYKFGLIINIPTGEYEVSHFQIFGNYYRSLRVKDQPHALNAFTIGIGISYH